VAGPSTGVYGVGSSHGASGGASILSHGSISGSVGVSGGSVGVSSGSVGVSSGLHGHVIDFVLGTRPLFNSVHPLLLSE